MAAPLACCALLAAGCGSSSLSSSQLRHKAARICSTAQHSTDSIAAPKSPEQTQRFLARGVAALAPAVAALHRLDPPGELGERYEQALHASDRELSGLRAALGGLKAGNDPAVAIRTLQSQLGPAEDRAGHAWREVGVGACATVMG